MKFSNLKKHLKAKKKNKNCFYKWVIDQGFGKMSMFYSSAFNGNNLLSIKAEEFHEIRFKNFKESLENPKNFFEFFNFPLEEKNDIKKNEQNEIDFDYFVNLPLNFFVLKNKEITRANCKNYDDYKILPPIFSKKKFSFDPFGIFFKTDFLIYEQVIFFFFCFYHYKKYKNISIDELKTCDKENTHKFINHYWTMQGSKFLMTYELKQIMKNIFFYESNKIKKENTSKMSINEIAEKNSEVKYDSNYFSPQKTPESQKIQMQGQNSALTTVKFIIEILDPQINFADFSNNSQILLNSKKNCLLIFYENFLKFDKFKLDLKKYMKFYFYELELFAASTILDLNNQIFWLNNDGLKKFKRAHSTFKEESYELKEGLLNRIAQCEYLSITLSYFKLSECEMDFSLSQPGANRRPDRKFLWNNEPRITNFSINTGKILSFMDSQSYGHFRNGINLLAFMVSSDKKMTETEKLNKDFLSELKKFSQQTIISNILEKINENLNIENRVKSNFEYSIESGEFSMVKESKPFLKFKIDNLKGSNLYFLDEACTSQLIIHKIIVKNLLETTEVDYSIIMTNFDGAKEHNEEKNPAMINLITQYNIVNGIIPNNKWKVYEKYEVKVVPLVIKMTEEIYNYYYEYLFTSQENDNLTSTETSYSSKKNEVDKQIKNKKSFKAEKKIKVICLL